MRLFVFFIVAYSLNSCKNVDPNQAIIDSYLQSITMGVKIENDFKEIKHIRDVKSSELLDDMYKQLEIDKNITPDSVLKELDSSILMEKDVWKHKRNRFSEIAKNDPNKIAYTLIEATHEFKNPLLNNALVSVTRTYIIGDIKVLGCIDKKDYEKYDNEYSRTPLTKYEVAIAEMALKKNN